MKEYSFIFDEGLTKGLRRFSANPTNEQTLIELFNLAPSPLGLEAHETLTNLNADDIEWGGLGAKAEVTDTRDITISIRDYVDDDINIEGAEVYIDDSLIGTTDENGEIDAIVTVGGHSIRVVAAGYVDSDQDDLLNDYFVVV